MILPYDKANKWCRSNDAANCIDVYLAGYEEAVDTLERLQDSKEFRKQWPDRFDRAVAAEVIEWAIEQIKGDGHAG